MNYFIVQNITNETDPDLQRYLKLKEQNDAILVITDYFRFTSARMKEWGIDEDHYINLFDYLQKTKTYRYEPIKLVNLNLKSDIPTVEFQPNKFAFYHNEYRYCVVTLNPDTENVDSVQFFDRFDHTLEIDAYDVRGFLSLKSIYGPAGGVAVDRMFSPVGELRYEEFYHEKEQGKEIVSSMAIVHQDIGDFEVVDSRNALIEYVLKQLNFSEKDQLFAPANFINKYQIKSYKIK